MINYMENEVDDRPKYNHESIFQNLILKKNARYIDGVYMVEFYKDEILYNKPIYVGCSSLDLSTLTMMKFHYDVIHKNFENIYNFIYSDIDSLVYNIKNDDIYE